MLQHKEIKTSFFVFDLDDTLFKEVDYQTSGYIQLIQLIKKIYGRDIEKEVKKLINKKDNDIMGKICQILEVPISVKESFLWFYRLHMPNISIEKDLKNTIEYINKTSKGVAILSDGRSVTQRSKIRSLGLNKFPCFISEEYEDEKPSLERFKIIMEKYDADKYIYVGDNPLKDFLAPNMLGWDTVGLLPNEDNMHIYTSKKKLPKNHSPNFWIKSISDLIQRI